MPEPVHHRPAHTVAEPASDTAARYDDLTRSPEWMAGEREATEQIARGEGTFFEDLDAMFAHLEGEPAPSPGIRIVSFGYGHPAPPPAAEIVCDLRRAFRNPHHDPEMRERTGLDEDVYRHVLATPGVEELTAAVATAAVNLHAAIGGPITVAAGCVGGRHRAVGAARKIADHITAAGITVELVHRDVHLDVLSGTHHADGLADPLPEPGTAVGSAQPHTTGRTFDLRALLGAGVDPVPVEELSPHELRWALTLAREEIAAHTIKWGEVEDTFGDEIACTPGCHGSHLIAPCEECDEEDEEDA
ncbi:RapZ C-terminal domain-containing protein [Embleya hyalina]|uniref:Nucleotide-binding protein n=1 Tax=Embleya hyalina TaxID=516124 RepID=A0A401YYT1_9ACTN|nr:RNase adapter RapZ [Embleya hyalina]GCD99748.1 nucleotide-binding protein [Embleya hyalina]